MTALVRERVGIKDIGIRTTVPDNPKAKLMYYLDCVAFVIDLNDSNLNRLRNYQNYHLLDDAETDELLVLVRLFSPHKLLNRVFFHSEDCGGSSNQFFELSAVSNMLAVADNIVIGGERKRVAKIMFFKRSWMESNYHTPIRSFHGPSPLLYFIGIILFGFSLFYMYRKFKCYTIRHYITLHYNMLKNKLAKYLQSFITIIRFHLRL